MLLSLLKLGHGADAALAVRTGQTVVRGKLTNALRDDIAEIFRLHQIKSGTVVLIRTSSRWKVITYGGAKSIHQAIANVVNL